ncbi:MAG: HAD family hydrolase [Candidatus Nezhaarchaeota archaeon]|nr:HAD family hydrolase [Candidatus Nezhaarchaeota archaeon]MCX8142039.1 HAD family hydrolase [Candidatus Nezhaarchaeota archaeon]MDW8050180.1 HAD family hydrolase [Nitrososphaerota archaeon]
MARLTVLVDLGNTLIHGPKIVEVFKDLVLRSELNLTSDLSSSAKLLQTFKEIYDKLKILKKKMLLEVSLRSMLRMTLRDTSINEGLVEKLRDLLVDRYVRTREVYGDAHTFLRGLKKAGSTIIVVSNTPDHQIALESLESLGLMRYVDDVVTSAQLGLRKPHPLVYLRALERACASTAIFVGDHVENDVVGPLRVGLYAIHVFRRGIRLKRSVNSLLKALEIILMRGACE